MSEAAAKLSPRQRECLQLVWERQATSKEIAIALGISKTTVDGYIREAVELLGATDRRDAARMIFGGTPRAEYGGDPAGVTGTPDDAPVPSVSTEAVPASRPWRTRGRNELTLAQTFGWVALITLGSLAALALAASIGNGMPNVWRPVLVAFRGLTL